MTDDAQVCPDADVATIVEGLARDDDQGMVALERLLARYQDDPRLHFLRGSVLAGRKSYVDAEASITRAVSLAPGYDIARFQLGFLQFTSGNAERAASTWTGLTGLPENAPLKLFAEGLNRLAVDDVAGAIALIRQGMAENLSHPAVNNDMTLLLNTLASDYPNTGGAEPTSSAELLLQQHKTTPTRH